MKMNDLYTSRLRTFRKESYYTQIELSEAIDITPEYYSALERGKKRPSMYLHVDLCLKLNRPSDCFFDVKKDYKFLTANQIDYLMNMKKEDLETILNVLQIIYDAKINR